VEENADDVDDVNVIGASDETEKRPSDSGTVWYPKYSVGVRLEEVDTESYGVVGR